MCAVLSVKVAHAYLPVDQSMVLLESGAPSVVNMVPYELYDVYIPVVQIQSNTEYSIQASFDGGYSVEIMMKRKAISTGDSLDKKSDFKKRFGNKLSQGLKLSDHRYPS